MSDLAVICVRGFRALHHPGNVACLQDVLEVLQIRFTGVDYQNDVPGPVKMAVGQEIIARVHERGGRFVKRYRTNADWYEDSYRNAYAKVAQCLRDEALLIRRSTAAAAAALPIAEPFEGSVDGMDVQSFWKSIEAEEIMLIEEENCIVSLPDHGHEGFDWVNYTTESMMNLRFTTEYSNVPGWLQHIESPLFSQKPTEVTGPTG